MKEIEVTDREQCINESMNVFFFLSFLLLVLRKVKHRLAVVVVVVMGYMMVWWVRMDGGGINEEATKQISFLHAQSLLTLRALHLILSHHRLRSLTNCKSSFCLLRNCFCKQMKMKEEVHDVVTHYILGYNAVYSHASIFFI